MPSLQIRDLPDPLHRLLQRRASLNKRSLSQQALWIWKHWWVVIPASGACWPWSASRDTGKGESRWHGSRHRKI